MFTHEDNYIKHLKNNYNNVQQLRKDRRNEMIKSNNDIEENLTNWILHDDPNSVKFRDYLVPNKLSIDNYNIPALFLYISARKMKSLEHTMPEINLLSAKSYS